MKKASMTLINSDIILEEMLRLEKILKSLGFADAEFAMDSAAIIYDEIKKTMGNDRAWEYLHANITYVSDLAQKKLEKNIEERYVVKASHGDYDLEAVKMWAYFLAFYLILALDTEAPINTNLDTDIQEEITHDLITELGLE